MLVFQYQIFIGSLCGPLLFPALAFSRGFLCGVGFSMRDVNEKAVMEGVVGEAYVDPQPLSGRVDPLLGVFIMLIMGLGALAHELKRAVEEPFNYRRFGSDLLMMFVGGVGIQFTNMLRDSDPVEAVVMACLAAIGGRQVLDYVVQASVRAFRAVIGGK